MRWWGTITGALLLIGVVVVASLAIYVVPRDDEIPPDADVVVVLGGAGADRAELGIEVAERYDIPLVLSSSASIFGQRQGRTCGTDAVCFEPDPANTAGEAATMARLAEVEGWDHIVVATSRFHTSRSRMLFSQCLGEDRVSVVGSLPPGRSATTPRLMTREALGVVAGLTVARAC